jgi:hypothetical protein
VYVWGGVFLKDYFLLPPVISFDVAFKQFCCSSEFPYNTVKNLGQGVAMKCSSSLEYNCNLCV